MVRYTLARALTLATLFAVGCTGQAPTENAKALDVTLCSVLGTGCCDSDSDCASSSCQTMTCNTTLHQCFVSADTCECNAVTALTGACDDKNACTIDSCSVEGKCEHTATALCCLSNTNCNDGDDCTIDTCSIGLGATAGSCQHTPIPDPLCCNQTADCGLGGAVGACGTLTCQVAGGNLYKTCGALTGGTTCCNQASDCPAQTCETASCTANKCVYAPTTGTGCCTEDSQCASGLNQCQVGVCSASACVVSVPTALIGASGGCCNSASDCGTSDACHAVHCIDNECVNQEIACTSKAPFEHPPVQRAVETTHGAVAPTSTDDGLVLRGGGCSTAPGQSSDTALFVVIALFSVVALRRHAA